MKKKTALYLLLFFLASPIFVSAQNSFRAPIVPGFFDTPDKGYFTVVPSNHDKTDATSPIHFWGSFGLRTSLYYYFKTRHSPLFNNNPGLWSTSITILLGLLKEEEDGMRVDGFSWTDFKYDLGGTALSCLTTFSLDLAFTKHVKPRKLSPIPLHSTSAELESQLYALAQKARDVFQKNNNFDHFANEEISLSWQPDSLRYFIKRNKTTFIINLKPLSLNFLSGSDTTTFTAEKLFVSGSLTNKKITLSTASPQNFNECQNLICQCRFLLDEINNKIYALETERKIQNLKKVQRKVL